jgi:hypothetical protein
MTVAEMMDFLRRCDPNALIGAQLPNVTPWMVADIEYRASSGEVLVIISPPDGPSG